MNTIDKTGPLDRPNMNILLWWYGDIRRYRNRLIFMMGIPITFNWIHGLYIDTEPCPLHDGRKNGSSFYQSREKAP